MSRAVPPQLSVPEIDCPATVPHLFARAVERYPDHPFFEDERGSWTYADIDRASLRLARHLVERGAGKGTRVGLLLPQGPEWAIGLLAAARIGAVSLPLSTFSTPWEAARALHLGDVAHLITAEQATDGPVRDFLEEALPELASTRSDVLRPTALPYLRSVTWIDQTVVPRWGVSANLATGPIDDPLIRAMEQQVTPADWFVVIFTSGTTSGPKAVIHSHGAQVRQAVQFTQLRDQTHDDRFFAALPFFWVGGLTMALLPAIHLGTTVVCQRRFEPGAALDLVEHTRPTVYMGWPHIPQRMRAHPSFAARDLADVPFLSAPSQQGADPAAFHNALGMTETSAMHSMAPRGEVDRVLPTHLRGSYGAPLPGVQHLIIDPDTGAELPEGTDGEICVRGYSLMQGLYKREREEVFESDGWYRTGDRGHLRDGLLFFTGRATDLIKTGGSNVSAAEVEVALRELSYVRSAVVIGLDDAERGQIVGAMVSVVPGERPSVPQLLADVRRLVSVYKVPRRVLLVDESEIPWLPSGKIDQRAVAARLAQA